MSVTLYFAKLNLVSEDIYKLYENPSLRKNISSALYAAVNSNPVWEKESIFLDETGEPHSTVVEYSTHILHWDDTYTYIEGWLYKKSKLHYKTLNKETKELISHSTENTEGIRFTLDLDHGFVGYNTSARFGYKEFTEAFVKLINIGEEKTENDYRYSIGLCTSGLSLDDIKKELSGIGRIKELRIRMQPPNPSEALLDELQKRCDGVVKEFQEANVTEVELFYSSKGSSGINITAPFIEEKIHDIQGLHSTLSVEESTKKGYVTVEATAASGRKYSSGESKPFRKVIDVIEDLFDACIEAFRQLR